MAKKSVFYSFHFDNDVFRVQQIRNMGVLEGNQPVTPSEWETVKRLGKDAVKNWIDENMKYKNCVVVLIGEETSKRPWVLYEIEKAWNDGRPLVGIYIHNLKDPKTGKSLKGSNPFDLIRMNNGAKLSTRIKCHNPNPLDAYNDIDNNIKSWIEEAIRR